MGYEFESVFPEIMGGAAAGVAGVALGIFVIVYLVVLAWGIVSYVLGAVGMYRIAKRRGIHHPWLAWIPVGNCWLLGSIADHYQYIAKQKTTYRRRVLLILNIIAVASGFLLGLTTSLSESFMTGSAVGILMIAFTVIASLAAIGVAIANAVFCYIAYYDLFRSCKPNNAVLFLILSIVFSATLPVFVFACSNFDQGMPPRRVVQPATQIPYQQTWQQPAYQPPVQEAPVQEAPVEESIPVVETQLVEEDE